MKKLTAWIIMGALAATIVGGCAAKDEMPSDTPGTTGADTKKAPTDADTE